MVRGMLTARFELTIPGRPVADQRARVTRRGTYKPDKCRHYKDRVFACWHKAGRPRVDCSNGLAVSGRFFVARPKSHYTSKGKLRTGAPVNLMVRPDLDNYVKLLLDSLNGLAWRDDSRIVSMTVSKGYVDSGDERAELMAVPVEGLQDWELDCLEARESIARGEGLSLEEVFGEGCDDYG